MIQRRRVTLQGHFDMQKEIYQSLIMRDKSPFAPAKRNDPLSRSAEKKTAFRNKLLQNSFDLCHVQSVLRLAERSLCETTRTVRATSRETRQISNMQPVRDGSRTKNNGFQTSTTAARPSAPD